jgi:uncharacterized metal-binding protein YceD (DUF177 family)
MKWTIHELKKLSRNNPTFEYVTDLSMYLEDQIPDVIDIGPVYVRGSFQLQNHDSEYWFHIFVRTTLFMPCAITLETVEVPLVFESELHFARTEIDDSTFLIDGITIDLDPVIWAEILVEKPMRVTIEGASIESVHENFTLSDDELDMKNPFAALKKDLK